ncbi:Crp/Fnr family transcriptional regulator [uncultured Duncaniella sp.]|uniref:Crp/Fnr family transcriptional regulator n=1 Tax=uncultured Duncaniella sp. TaxID=2768039 RepID=UPI0026EB89F1|nr:Crp/Fnr family transcriptional regulator [uncultured Duncaniella sp.]
MAQFNSYLDVLDPTAATDYCRENGTVCHYKKEERFIQQGTVARYAALVVSGYFKLTTLNESGNEAVINFAFPGQIITDIHSSIYGEPSEMSVIAGADSEILRVQLKEFASLLSSNLFVEHSALFKMTYMRCLNLYRKSPEQRYVELCRDYPNIVETVSLKDLASYLLITPGHLSRIRRKLAAILR